LNENAFSASPLTTFEKCMIITHFSNSCCTVQCTNLKNLSLPSKIANTLKNRKGDAEYAICMEHDADNA